MSALPRLSRRHVLRRVAHLGLAAPSLALLSACGMLPSLPAPAAKVRRIGFLGATSPSVEVDPIEAFRQGLRELGYVEGDNVVLEWRWAEGQLERLPDLAADLARLKVEVIVAGGATSTRAAKAVTTTIPIVMAQNTDPVGSGDVASLARPGGNITGLSSLGSQLSGKRLQLLNETVPQLSRVAVLDDSMTAGYAQAVSETELAARTLGLQLHYLDVHGPEELEMAFREATQGGADGLLVQGGPLFISQRRLIADLAVKYRLPATYSRPENVTDGGLMTYTVSIPDLYRRAATYVDKILKGAKPADLPVEQPMKFEFIINLKAAKALSLTIPRSVLEQTTSVIQ